VLPNRLQALNRSTLYIPIQPRNSTVQCISLAHFTLQVLAFSMLPSVPAQSLKVVPRPYGRLSPRGSAGGHCAVYSANCLHNDCFHNDANPFSRNPFVFKSIQNLRGVAFRGLSSKHSAISVSRCLWQIPSHSEVTPFEQLAASCSLLALFSALAPFVFKGLQPLFRNTGGWGGVSAYKSTHTPNVQTSLRSSDAPSESQTGSRDVPTVRCLPQRGRLSHIQLSLLLGQGSQVYG
jgi:hypothetical protein